MKAFQLRVVLAAFLCLLIVVGGNAAVAVRGYTRKDGTYVAPYHRTAPNGTKNDNYSTKGNVNPYTGQAGTKPGDAPASGSTGSSATAAPISAGSQTPAKDNAPPAPAKDAPPPSPWTKLHVGMTKAEVMAAIGKPQMSTAKKWVYGDTGFVTFDDKGTADSISAPK